MQMQAAEDKGKGTCFKWRLAKNVNFLSSSPGIAIDSNGNIS